MNQNLSSDVLFLYHLLCCSQERGLEIHYRMVLWLCTPEHLHNVSPESYSFSKRCWGDIAGKPAVNFSKRYCSRYRSDIYLNMQSVSEHSDQRCGWRIPGLRSGWWRSLPCPWAVWASGTWCGCPAPASACPQTSCLWLWGTNTPRPAGPVHQGGLPAEEVGV